MYEKEKRLRMMMRMHGLSNGVYIAVTYLYLILLYVVYIAVMMAVGAAVGLGFFRNNSAGAVCNITFALDHEFDQNPGTMLQHCAVGIVMGSCTLPHQESHMSASMCMLAGVQIVFYFLYGNVQIAFCFLLSCFFTKQRTATIVAYLWVFGTGLVARQLLENLFIHERWFTILIELIPTLAAYRCATVSSRELHTRLACRAHALLV